MKHLALIVMLMAITVQAGGQRGGTGVRTDQFAQGVRGLSLYDPQGAVDLDGSTEYFTEISTAGRITNVSSISICAWVNPRVLGDIDTVFRLYGIGAEFIVMYRTSNAGFSFYSAQGGRYDMQAATVITNAWHFLVCTWTTNSAYQFFYDGTRKATTSGATQPLVVATNLNIGVSQSSGVPVSCFNGLLDEVYVFTNRVVSSNEYAELYAGGVGKPLTDLSTGLSNLAIYCKFNGMTTQTNYVDDASGTTWTGTAIGAGDWTTGIVPLKGRP